MSSLRRYSAFFLILCLAGLASAALKTVLLIMRHGDRTTDKPLFPSDPNINSSSFFVNGKGDITEDGRRQSYDLGKRLRDMYQSFLTNNTQEVHAESSDYSRNIISVGCVLIGMYQPEDNDTCMAENQTFPKTILSVPLETVPVDRDYKLSTIASCPAKDREKEIMENSTETKEFFSRNNVSIFTLQHNTREVITEAKSVYDIYDNLFIEKTHQLNLSSWVEPMWPTLQAMASEELLLEFQTNTSIKLTTGPLLNDIVSKMNMTNSTDMHKLYLYGTHDSNIQALMMALGVFNALPPPYTATFVVELHDDDTVKLLYINSTQAPVSITLSQCQNKEYCPVHQFMDIAMPFVVTDPKMECASAGVRVTGGVIVVLLQLFFFFFLQF